MKKYDVLVIGGGIYGITAAVELAKRKYKVGLINPDTIPHHMAASTDVTKAVRMEYGSDWEYFRMVEKSIEKWKEWNDFFGEKLYHEVGFLMLCKEAIESENHTFEKYSYQHLLEAGYKPDRLNATEIKKRFPSVNADEYIDANFNASAGYADAALTVEKLATYSRTLGVVIHEGQTADSFQIENGVLSAVKTKEGETFHCGHALVAAGAHTPMLLPELQPYMRSTGHPVFWLKPKNPDNFVPPRFSVFTADISNSGWYGFPFLEKWGIVKIAKHSNGVGIHPDNDDRQITDDEVKDMRSFVKQTFPELWDAPLVFTRRCLYIDTLDGHFWIDRHPEIQGLSVSSGGSGHGLKMAPILGAMVADIIEGKSHEFSKRYRWRHLTADTSQVEEARYVIDRKL
ncbi:NAD(P)/FAD-dependent oxidoreductase [Flagellimonas meridianipacifica]|uniref:Sarcosine oxidase / L-pipecolate oxidase n=1 Tax=Flagellimonas meridianipacifica TaxID=1080225 RepID=A0A2T0MBP9_9FLAO|nr:FAD-dependent oxidoreductase [Allomuricauda pacifica]PRX54927.1 sarcosine oxidase / L-pipecolate oxidase [Allomuricauda pacifica]